MIESNISIPQRKPRRFLPEEFKLDTWENIERYFNKLKSRPINNLRELQEWIYDRGELESVLYEDYSWRYIKMTLDTTDKEVADKFNYYVTKIQPKVIPMLHELDQKLMASPYLAHLDKKEFEVYLKRVKSGMDIYTEKNIELFSRMKIKENEYASISGSMTIEHNGKELTMPQAANLLKSTDRAEREAVFKKISKRRLEDAGRLDSLMNELIVLRQQVAQNAGFENYRDYKHKELGRFDYSVEDVLEFHEAIRTEIVPLEKEMMKVRKEKLGYDELRPWDLSVDINAKPPLKPFESEEELIDKVKWVFYKTHPYFGERLDIMGQMKHLDLQSRKGKAPGGYNSTLSEIGVPFIFMNASGSSRDVRTMIHEGGHAVHSFLMRDIPFMPNRNIPSEIAELASMSMELMTFDKWDLLYEGKSDLNRARLEQLEGVLSVLPWVAVIDKFQHWIYTNPSHSIEERTKEWKSILEEFSPGLVSWEGFEASREKMWQRQLHIYEVPFYYIEYAIAQLGAIAVWKSYKENPDQTVQRYMKALSLGYTTSMKDMYETAGIQFDFSQEYVRELARFVRKEMEALS